MDAVDQRLEQARAAHARRDWPTAYDLFSEVRRSGDLSADDLFALADAAWWLGLIRETLAVSEECHERYLSEGRVEDAAMVALGTGFNWFLRGQPEIGTGWVSRGQRLLEDVPPCVAHGFLLSMEADERLAAGDVDGALEVADRLLQLGKRIGEPVLASFALAVQGEAAIHRGDARRGFALLDEAMLPVLAGRVPPDMAGNLYCRMMTLCHRLADASRARHWTDVTESWCETFSSAVMFAGICRVHRSQLLRLQGFWEEAERSSSLATVELAELNVEAVGEAHYELGEIHRLRGDLVAAETCFAAARSLGRDPQPGAALLLLAQGRGEDAAAALRVLLTEVTDPFLRVRLLHAQAQVGVALDDAALVRASTGELDLHATTYRTAGFQAWAEHDRGAAHLLAGEYAVALRSLRAARATYESMAASYDVATTRLLIARALRESGDTAGATAEERLADEALASLGAARPPGLAAPIADAPLPGGLTAREVEILVAVCEGLSNRDVAARLVISEKTVARHLANIYAKIDVTSRTAAMAWAHRNRLAPAT
jgi:ATP/maltotriose-dependent transcriptional regulator MalT